MVFAGTAVLPAVFAVSVLTLVLLVPPPQLVNDEMAIVSAMKSTKFQMIAFIKTPAVTRRPVTLILSTLR